MLKWQIKYWNHGLQNCCSRFEFLLFCCNISTPSRPNFQVDKFQRSAKTTAKEHETALVNSTAKLSVAEAAIGRAYIAGGGVDAELQHAQVANKVLESRVTELLLQV